MNLPHEGVFAVIDIGTNSCLLLIATLRHGQVTPLLQKVQVPRIGRGLKQTGFISSEAEGDLELALLDFKQCITQKRAQLVGVVATAAFRHAGNGAAALARVSSQLGYPARILSGEEEAQMSFDAVHQRYPENDLTVVDLGGGSTEIQSSGQGISLPIGAVSMRELHGNSRADLLAAATQIFRQGLTPKPVLSPWPIVVGGTASALAMLDLGMLVFDAETLEGHRLDKATLAHWVRFISGLSDRERNSLPGLDPGRGEILLAGACILSALVEVAGLEGIRVSDRGLRFGLLFAGVQKFEKESASSLQSPSLLSLKSNPTERALS